jgi:hypothetical protein
MKKRIGFSLLFIVTAIAFTGIFTNVSASVLDCPTTFLLNLEPGASFTFKGNTTGYPSNADGYSCTTWNEHGPEIVYGGFSTAIHGTLTATLSNLGVVDLDIFILNSCDSDNCVASGDVSAAYNNAPPGQYFFSVDGYGSEYELSHRGPYTINITAQCSPPVELTLGAAYLGTTLGNPSNVVSYPGSPWSETGPEAVHRITTSRTGIIRAELNSITPVGQDLDVFILSDCVADTMLAFGGQAAEYANAPPGTYYVVVDGYNGSAADYSLTVTSISCENVICYDGNECTADECNPNTGTCSFVNKTAGSSCGDPASNDCTNPDTCNGAGICLANDDPAGVTCREDGNECTDDFCDGDGSCSHPFEPAGLQCGNRSQEY